jgi:beta-mannosidase
MASSTERKVLATGWQAACSPPDRDLGPSELEGLDWIDADVPGTAAGALRNAGRWRLGEPYDFDGEDWWFRTGFEAEPAQPGEEVALGVDGIATVAEVYLNGELVLENESMFRARTVDVGERLRSGRPNELTIRCRALAPLLAESRRPRARWRTKLVSERNLRFFRTMLLGRAPGFAPGPAAVGPWRAVWLERRRQVAVEELLLRPRLDGADGVLAVRARLRALDGKRIESVAVEVDGPGGVRRAELRRDGPSGTPDVEADGQAQAFDAEGERRARAEAFAGELRVRDVERWWPHTHGEPALYDVRLLVEVALSEEIGGEPDGGPDGERGGARGEVAVAGERVGFRELRFGPEPGHEVLKDGIDLYVNGVKVFVRGAVWTPPDPVGMAPDEEELRAALAQAKEAGMNMVRLPGTSAYEAAAFWDLCDELGMLVWQDFMFANFDYPIVDERLKANVVAEVRQALGVAGGRPSLAVLCGNSEVEQQVAMLGLDPALGRGKLFGELLPRLIEESGIDAVYVPSAPCGGELPFRPGVGIANYYGVGGYMRPIEDARRAGVRFASECLAFSNVPSGVYEREVGVPQDEGTDWDFKDVRDHYLDLLFGLDPAELEREDRERYVELAKASTGEVMAEVFGEWRRASSGCGGGLVLWLRDLSPGAGWGVIGSDGTPKPAYYDLKRALQPVAIWTIDEGLGGIVAHVANDGPDPLRATLRIAFYRDGEVCGEQTSLPIELRPHSQAEWNAETLVGGFRDASWAYRFGPPAQDAIVVSLERGPTLPAPRARTTGATGATDDLGPAQATNKADDGEQETDVQTIGQAIRFPAGRPLQREAPETLGLSARARALPDGAVGLVVESARLAYGVRVEAAGLLPSDDGFFVEPGGTHELTLKPIGQNVQPERVRLGAINMDGFVEVALHGDLAGTVTATGGSR